ncbi:MAG: carbohydrate-binding protein, partial [Verrucomicrobiaceae bacterium]
GAVEAADLAGYRLHRSGVAGFTPDTANLLVSPAEPDVSYLDEGVEVGTTYHYRLIAVDDQGNLSASTDEVRVTAELRNLPYHGAPHGVPGVIQAEDFDFGGEGIAYSDTTASNLGGSHRPDEAVDLEFTTDAGGGHQVAGVGGEWLEYTVNMEHAGGYVLALRISAAAEGGVLSFEIDGNAVSGGIGIPATGEGIWQTVTVPEVELPQGTRVLRLKIDSHATDGSEVLINWFSLTPVVRTGPTADAGMDRIVADEDFNGEEALTLDASGSFAGDSEITGYEWTKDGFVVGTGISPVVTLPLGQHTITLTVTDANGQQDTDDLTISVTAQGFVNGGFENGFTGWTTSGNLSTQSGSPYVITEGTRLVAFNNDERTPNGVLSQTFATVPG